MALVKVATLDNLKPGEARTVIVSGKEIALYNVSGKIFATTNACAHEQGPLGQGSLEDNVITCPLHGWQFDVETGSCRTVPGLKIETYRVEVRGKDILVDV
ncbi:MAG: Rieske 2Fe-2S domain-containing protein [Candidatus Aenigmarchaeota archaeon]|nr:Rieske 2Fe-2S domain-containing protein [Candidatus Aenigmarchaeota archaeon]